MASVKFYLDTRRELADGSYPLALAVSQQRRTRYVRLGISLKKDQWDGAMVTKHPMARRLNADLATKRYAAEMCVYESDERLDVTELSRLVAIAVFPEREEPEDTPCAKCVTVADALRAAMDRKKERSTKESYGCTLKHVERYDPSATLDDVTPAWLSGLDDSMSATAKSVNARGIYMRNLRAVFNFAINEGFTSNYPFRKYRIRKVDTEKRDISAEDIRKLHAIDVEEWQRPYRDFFMMSFLLMGINAKDLLTLPVSADSGGRIIFNRAKTKKLYSMRVEPEAQELIERYRGKKHMLSFLDTREDHKQYIRQCNHALKTIGMNTRKGKKSEGVPLWPFLTTYYARHSWATIAAELDIPKETIAAALGHDMGNSTTAIYINFNRKKVDEANRKVIDYVLYGKR